MRLRRGLLLVALTIVLAGELTALETVRGVVRDGSDFQCSFGCGTYYVEPDPPYVTMMLGGDFHVYLDQHVQMTGTIGFCSGCQVLFVTMPVVLLPPLSVESGVPDLLPRAFALGQNFPNPFNPATRIRYDLPVGANVLLQVYTLAGQRVATIVDGFEEAGFRSVEFSAGGLASGLYILRLSAEAPGATFTDVRKMLLLR